jgi:glucose/arabinose dehydrogenase
MFKQIIAVIIAAGVVGCGGEEGGDIQEPGTVTAVSVNAPSNTLNVGQTLQLTAVARDAGGTVVEGHIFEWATGNETVASVSPSGLVSGLSAGQVEISATTDGVTGRITLTVIAAPPPTPVTPGLEQVAAGLNFPLYLTSPPGDNRLFILEKDGVIRLIKDGTLLTAPFLDLEDFKVSTGAEQGLLGLAFTPDYASSGQFFVHYTAPDGESRISRYLVSADPDRADPASEVVVLVAARPGIAHNGGQILFGPDGMLYIGLGDGDDSDGGRGQSRADLLASILRVDVSIADNYAVPADNPFTATAGAPEIWSYGLRNPWRFSFDRGTGDFYISDVGQGEREEVNYSSAAEGAGRGLNYGWSVMEGSRCVRGAGCDQTGLTLPTVEYDHSEGCSVTGGYVYRGTAMPALHGNYFYADYCAGWVRSFKIQGGLVTEETDWPALEPGGQITSFGEDAQGELYLLTEQGGVFKIVPQ